VIEREEFAFVGALALLYSLAEDWECRFGSRIDIDPSWLHSDKIRVLSPFSRAFFSSYTKDLRATSSIASRVNSFPTWWRRFDYSIRFLIEFYDKINDSPFPPFLLIRRGAIDRKSYNDLVTRFLNWYIKLLLVLRSKPPILHEREREGKKKKTNYRTRNKISMHRHFISR